MSLVYNHIVICLYYTVINVVIEIPAYPGHNPDKHRRKQIWTMGTFHFFSEQLPSPSHSLCKMLWKSGAINRQVQRGDGWGHCLERNQKAIQHGGSGLQLPGSSFDAGIDCNAVTWIGLVTRPAVTVANDQGEVMHFYQSQFTNPVAQIETHY